MSDMEPPTSDVEEPSGGTLGRDTQQLSGFMMDTETIDMQAKSTASIYSRRGSKRMSHLDPLRKNSTETVCSEALAQNVMQFDTIVGDVDGLAIKWGELKPILSAHKFSMLNPNKPPRQVFLIYLGSFIDRFCHIGVRILSISLLDSFFGEDTLRDPVSYFQIMVSLVGLILAFVSDGILGTFKCYIVCSLICTLSSAAMFFSTFGTGLATQVTFISAMMFFIIGTSGYKSANVVLGADQFWLPDQAQALLAFFYTNYFWACCGQAIPQMCAPVMLQTMSCENYKCYAFGFFIVMCLHLFLFLVLICNRRNFARYRPKLNSPLRMIQCISQAAQNRCRSTATESDEDWLDHMRPTFGQLTVQNARTMLEVVLVFAMAPIYWSVFYNAGTLWPFLAQRMTGRFTETLEVMPEQLMAIESCCSILMVPVAYMLLMPLLKRLGIVLATHRLVVGAFLSALSNLLYCMMAMAVITADVLPVIGVGTCEVRFYNPTDCDFVLLSPEISINNISVPSMEWRAFQSVRWDPDVQFYYMMKKTGCSEKYPTAGVLDLDHLAANAVYFSNGNIEVSNDVYTEVDELRHPLFRFITESKDRRKTSFRMYRQENVLNISVNSTDWYQRVPGLYHFDNNQKTRLEMGGIYNFLVHITIEGNMTVKPCTITPPNSLHILWMLPSIIFLSCAEVMFVIPCIVLAYKHGPVGMKNISVNMFLVTNGFGNAINLLLDAMGLKEERLYAATLTLLMFLAAFILLVISDNFKYVHKYVVSDDDFLKLIESHDLSEEEEERSLPEDEDQRTIADIIAHNQRIVATRDESKMARIASRKTIT